MSMANQLVLNQHYEYWRRTRITRRKRLKQFIELDAPQIIIDQENDLIAYAWENMMAWQIFFEATEWEVDIVTGELQIFKLTGAGNLLYAIFFDLDAMETVTDMMDDHE